jgi:hypothetical protein
MTSAHDAALEPLRTALIARARAEAAEERASAEADGQRVLAAAQQQAEVVLADARAQGEADAAALLAAQRARSRRAARGIVLGAQRAAYDELSERACAAVRELLADPARRACLEAVARGKLGDRVVVRVLPEGGLVAETADGRRVDASVQALVDSAVANLDLEQLWAP